MVRQSGSDKIKSSARRLISKATAIYISDQTEKLPAANETIPVFMRLDLSALIDHLRTSSEFKL